MNYTHRFMLYAFWVCVLMLPVSTAILVRHVEGKQIVRIAYTNWASSVASANLVKAVFQEKLGMRCDLMQMDARRMWEASANGEVDAMLSAWLPDTHAHYMEEFADQVVDLGPNLIGTRTGLVVPDVKLSRLAAGAGIRKSYIHIDSMEEIKGHAEKFQHRIIGIEPEAGIMRQTALAMKAYGLEGFELIHSNESKMIKALSEAILHQRWIVITGWVPHWSFARWNLKFLHDPQNIYGEKGNIHTIARSGLREDMPKAFDFLDNFFWEAEDVGQLMLWIEDDSGWFPYGKALRWMQVNPEKIVPWIE